MSFLQFLAIESYFLSLIWKVQFLKQLQSTNVATCTFSKQSEGFQSSSRWKLQGGSENYVPCLDYQWGGKGDHLADTGLPCPNYDGWKL